MGMSDCIRCWDTPCTCGYDYRNDSQEERIRQASVVLGISPEVLERLVEDYIPEKHPMAD
jgi:hypothetical protein